MPFSPKPDQVDANSFFKAEAMSAYLERYVESHVYKGQSIRDRIIFSTSVVKVGKLDSIWHMHCSKSREMNVKMLLKAPKLIVASGATSIPNVPSIKGSQSFQGSMIHSVEWGNASFLEDGSQKRVVVLGGGKSAADIVYECVKAGKTVSWVIRKSGKGPGAFFPGEKIGWFQNPSELGVSRLNTYLFLSGLGRKGWWYWFLFNTRIGQWFYRKSGEGGGKAAAQEPDWYGREGARKSYKQLDPKLE